MRKGTNVSDKNADVCLSCPLPECDGEDERCPLHEAVGKRDYDREYKRAYRKTERGREKVNAANRKYRRKNADEVNRKKREYWAENKDWLDKRPRKTNIRRNRS